MGMAILVCDNTEVFHVGDVIRKRRHERGLSLEELSDLAGVNKATISQVERGEANPRADTIEKIAGALGMTTTEIYAALVLAALPARHDHGVEDGTIDVSDFTPHDIPVIAEGEASPQGSLFWSDEGVLASEVEDRLSRPRDVADPRAYGVRVRGDSMLPVFKPGMLLIVSPRVAVADGDEVYVELLTGERLIKIARRMRDGWLLESANPIYPPRFVTKAEIGAMHPVLYARRRRMPNP